MSQSTTTTASITSITTSTKGEASPSRMQSLRRRLRRHPVDDTLVPDFLAYTTGSGRADMAVSTTKSTAPQSRCKEGDQRTLKSKQLSSSFNKLHKEEVVPSSSVEEPHYLSRDEQEQEQDAASTTDGTVVVGSSSSSSSSSSNRFQGHYEPDPVVPQSVILAIGMFVFVLAVIWPPLILLFAYCASKLIPYSFRVNDDASTRRQLFCEFAQEDDYLPEEFKTVPPHIQLRESYWVNAR